MKYQQLENLEAGWKWTYLVKKWKEGEAITSFIDQSEANAAVKILLLILNTNQPKLSSGLITICPVI